MINDIDRIFESIRKYNDLIGNTRGLVFSDLSKYTSQKKAIHEELQEFEDADNHSILELDGICDIIVTCFGLLHLCDFDYKKYLEGRSGMQCVKYIKSSIFTDNPSKLSLKACMTINGLLNTKLYKDWYDMPGAMHEVNKSNMSKICISSKEVKETIEKYEDIGVEIRFNGGLPECMPICVGPLDDKLKGNSPLIGFTGNDGKNYFPGKGLKGVNFKKPQLGEFINE